jgi:ATP-dependent Clp protease adaptor protein ClpS
MTQTQGNPEESNVRLKGPGKFNVIMLNDDQTPMEFVIQILVNTFSHDSEKATAIMLEVHEKGRGIAGTYMFEVAEQKAHETFSLARNYGYPLTVTVEEAE